MNNRVSNRAVGKIFRTLGFILVLASSIIILSQLVLTNTSNSVMAFLEPYANMAQNVIDQLGFPIEEYAFLGFIVGLLFLVWALRKGLILRLLLSVLLIFVFAEGVVNDNALFMGILLPNASFIDSAGNQIGSYVNQLVAQSPYVVPGASLLAGLFLWFLFANKKPKRLSVQVIRVASIFLLLAIMSASLVIVLSSPIFAEPWYITVELVLYALSYVLFILSGVLGLLGFARS